MCQEVGQAACMRACRTPRVYTVREPVHDGAEQMMKPDSALLNVCRTCARLACWRVACVPVSTASVKHTHGEVACGKGARFPNAHLVREWLHERALRSA